MKNPLVTVFIAVYNAETYIREALESIINQSYKNLEILIVNDGSTDCSMDIINSYNDPRLRTINNSKNMGIPFTRNLGLAEAKGKYLIIMDADDIAYPKRIEKQVEFMENNPEIIASGSGYKYFGTIFRKKRSSTIFPEQFRIKLLFTSPIANPTAILRMAVLRDKKIQYDPNFFVAQDYNMWVQLSKIGDLCVIPDILLKYRVGHTNATKLSRTKKAKERKKLVDCIHKDVLGYYEFNLTIPEIETFNNFFTDNPDYIERIDYDMLLQLIKKLRDINIQKNIFPSHLFNKELQIRALVSISNINMSITKKISIYKEICIELGYTMNFKAFCYFFIKVIYSFIKSYTTYIRKRDL